MWNVTTLSTAVSPLVMTKYECIDMVLTIHFIGRETSDDKFTSGYDNNYEDN